MLASHREKKVVPRRKVKNQQGNEEKKKRYKKRVKATQENIQKSFKRKNTTCTSSHSSLYLKRKVKAFVVSSGGAAHFTRVSLFEGERWYKKKKKKRTKLTLYFIFGKSFWLLISLAPATKRICIGVDQKKD